MENIRFKNQNNHELSAQIEFPIHQNPKAYALFAHCFTCNKNLHAVRNISKALAQQGIAVMRFDFTGLGDSEGDFSDTNFSSNVQDLVSAAAALKERFEAPKLIIGHSLGGAAVIFAANLIPSIEAVATIGAPSSPEHVSHLFDDHLDQINANDQASVNIGGRSFTMKKQFLDDISSQNMQETLAQLKKPLVVFHSPQDRIVGIENAGTIYQHAIHPKSFISLDGADHLLTNEADSNYVGNVIAGWSNRYLNISKQESLKSTQQVGVQIGEDKYTTQVVAGKHALVADEPRSVGGLDYGPSPYDLLLASVGTCTAMTLKMYADHKKWKVTKIDVHLNHSKIHADDCETCENTGSKIDVIDRIIEVEGEIEEHQRQKLLEIADKCPVHRTLHNTIQINTRMGALKSA